MAKSYYAILGISSSATTEEVKSAYRRLAKSYHPDHYTGGNDIFREIQEAYAVLGDPLRRHQYERGIQESSYRIPVHRSSGPGPEPLIPSKKGVDIGEISPIRSFERYTPSFDEIFDWLWRNFSNIGMPKSGHVENLTMEVPLTAEQAFMGGTVKVMVPARAVCPTCKGVGAFGDYACSRCAGEGAIVGEMPVMVSFPSGFARDHAVMIPLERFGIRNLHLTVIFRPAGTERF